jgi:hypothetical protein
MLDGSDDFSLVEIYVQRGPAWVLRMLGEFARDRGQVDASDRLDKLASRAARLSATNEPAPWRRPGTDAERSKLRQLWDRHGAAAMVAAVAERCSSFDGTLEPEWIALGQDVVDVARRITGGGDPN